MARERVAENPVRYLSLMFQKMVTLWADESFAANWSTINGNTPSPTTFRTVSNVYYYLLLTVALFAYSISAQLRRSLMPLALFAALITLLHAIAVTDPRYHYVAMPCIILAAAYTLPSILILARRLPFHRIPKTHD